MKLKRISNDYGYKFITNHIPMRKIAKYDPLDIGRGIAYTRIVFCSYHRFVWNFLKDCQNSNKIFIKGGVEMVNSELRSEMLAKDRRCDCKHYYND